MERKTKLEEFLETLTTGRCVECGKITEHHCAACGMWLCGQQCAGKSWFPGKKHFETCDTVSNIRKIQYSNIMSIMNPPKNNTPTQVFPVSMPFGDDDDIDMEFIHTAENQMKRVKPNYDSLTPRTKRVKLNNPEFVDERHHGPFSAIDIAKYIPDTVLNRGLEYYINDTLGHASLNQRFEDFYPNVVFPLLKAFAVQHVRSIKNNEHPPTGLSQEAVRRVLSNFEFRGFVTFDDASDISGKSLMNVANIQQAICFFNCRHEKNKILTMEFAMKKRCQNLNNPFASSGFFYTIPIENLWFHIENTKDIEKLETFKFVKNLWIRIDADHDVGDDIEKILTTPWSAMRNHILRMHVKNLHLNISDDHGFLQYMSTPVVNTTQATSTLNMHQYDMDMEFEGHLITAEGTDKKRTLIVDFCVDVAMHMKEWSVIRDLRVHAVELDTPCQLRAVYEHIMSKGIMTKLPLYKLDVDVACCSRLTTLVTLMLFDPKRISVNAIEKQHGNHNMCTSKMGAMPRNAAPSALRHLSIFVHTWNKDIVSVTVGANEVHITPSSTFWTPLVEASANTLYSAHIIPGTHFVDSIYVEHVLPFIEKLKNCTSLKKLSLLGVLMFDEPVAHAVSLWLENMKLQSLSITTLPKHWPTAERLTVDAEIRVISKAFFAGKNKIITTKPSVLRARVQRAQNTQNCSSFAVQLSILIPSAREIIVDETHPVGYNVDSSDDIYYIPMDLNNSNNVKRIEVIGHQSNVDWPRLMWLIADGGVVHISETEEMNAYNLVDTHVSECMRTVNELVHNHNFSNQLSSKLILRSGTQYQKKGPERLEFKCALPDFRNAMSIIASPWLRLNHIKVITNDDEKYVLDLVIQALLLLLILIGVSPAAPEQPVKLEIDTTTGKRFFITSASDFTGIVYDNMFANVWYRHPPADFRETCNMLITRVLHGPKH